MYNRRPKCRDDLILAFKSSDNPDLLDVERKFEERLNCYLTGTGVPELAGWVPHPDDLDADDPATRSLLLLKAATSTYLKPLTPGYTVKVSSNSSSPAYPCPNYLL